VSWTRASAGQVTSFLGAAAVIVAYAADRGTYGIVPREQAALLIWFALLLIAALGLLPARRPGTPAALALLALALLASWIAIGLSWSESDQRTLAEVARTLHHLGLLALVIVLAGRERWIAVVAGATAGAAIVVGWALGIRLAPGLFGEDTTALAFATNRLSSPLGYWNATGIWSAMTAILLVAWSAHARMYLVRAAALAIVPAVLVALYLSYSRGALASLAVGTIVLVTFAPRRWATAAHVLAAVALGALAVLVTRSQPQIAGFTGTEGRRAIVAALAACGAGGALVAWATGVSGLDSLRLSPATARRALAWGLAATAVVAVIASVTVIPKAWDEFTSAALTQQPSGDPAARLTNFNSGRYAIYSSALESFADRPLKGSGAGTFEFTWNRDARTPEFVRDAHSLYLEAFSELGVIGGLLVLLFAGSVVAVFVSARRATQADPLAAGVVAGGAGACCAYLVSAGVDWMWELTAVTALSLVLAGAAAAATLRDAAPMKAPYRIGASLAALVAILAILPGLRSATELSDSQAGVRRSDLAAALRDARDAEKSAPWAAEPHLQIALVEERTGRLDAARAELLAAQEREPTNWRIPFLLSRVEAARGDVGSALRAYRRARTLRPLGAFFADPNATAAPPER
jgi:hypothetical protein